MELGPHDPPDPAIALDARVRLLLREKVFALAELLKDLERLKMAWT
ncbi:MAG: hypothetical protein KGL02_10645 [Acidobacteriota bacterium]|nr:hypothetical protein [Acidobacteriota bacterium]